MSLAEPRSRRMKWSDDPRNIQWASDKSKFGYQMLTKMGWSEGYGLGSTLQGEKSHVKAKKKKNQLHGIGMKTSHDDDWIAHQDSFNALLSSLNSGNPESAGEKKIQSLEDRVRVTRTKIMYSRFVKSKDLSKASSNDLACIFGKRSQSAPATPQRSEDEEESLSDGSTASCPTRKRPKTSSSSTSVTGKPTSTEHGFTTISSGVSVADYFASKMAAIKKGVTLSTTNEVIKNEVDPVDETKIKKSKQRSVTFDITQSSSEEEETKNDETVECTSSKSKNKDKTRKKDKEVSVLNSDVESENDETTKNKKSENGRASVLQEDVVEISDDEDDTVKLKKKNKKSKKKLKNVEKEEDNIVENEVLLIGESDDEGEEEEKLKKKKKKKKSTSSLDAMQDEDVELAIRKKKKKKKGTRAEEEEGMAPDCVIICEKKKYSKERAEEDNVVEEDAEVDESSNSTTSNSESPPMSSSSSKKSKKSKKRKHQNESCVVAAFAGNIDSDLIDITNEVDTTSSSPSSSSKKSKKKKRKYENVDLTTDTSTEGCVSGEITATEERKKKRKKRHQSDGEDSDGGN